MIRWGWLVGVIGCTPVPEEGAGLVGAGVLDVFPSFLLEDEGGRIAVPPEAIPVAEDGTPLPVDRFTAWRTGFSPGQTVVIRLPDADPSSLPRWRAPTPGAGGVRLLDRDTGAWLPVMAELDAHPDAADAPVLLARPLVALPDGHRVAVVVTREVAPPPERFLALAEGRAPASLSPWEDHMADLLDDVAAAGTPREDVALAFDFSVDRGRVPLEAALAAAPVPETWEITSVRTATDGDGVAPYTWRAATGRFTVPTYLGDDGLLALDDAGVPQETGTGRHRLYIHVPDSVKDAPAGSVPVVLFGHGIFSTPENYLDDDGDRGGVLALLDELGAIAIATRWTGLSQDDRAETLGVARDFGRIARVPDHLVDTNAAVRSLQRLILEGDLLDDPVFQGLSGQSLPARGRLSYYGISLGGIEGAVQVASGAPFDAAVLHVAGGLWSTMLERSTHWAVFEPFVVETVPDPADRQLLYAMSQLFWDPVDPIAWTDGLDRLPTLFQESRGDEQVPNLGTRAVVRSAGGTVFGPSTDVPWALGDGAVVWTQYDPQTPLPPDVNRPPENTGAHNAPRRWPGQRTQTVAFLDPVAPGTLVHGCGDAPCTAANRGDGR